MIRINVIQNAAAARSYYASQDYHLEGQEKPAYWHGKAAELLGLKGEVKREDFESLCENRYPGTNNRITAKHLENRRVGYDLTFSVPKSVSIAYSLGADERLENEFRAAVAETMALAEKELQTRVRKNYAFENRTTGNMAWVDFLHTTSRPIKGQPDPQLHIHAVAFNLTHDNVENQWKAADFAHIKASAPHFQAIFRSNLANRLQKLGYSVTKKKDDFEITGIPERANKEFSRRTAQIDKLADDLGVVKPESKAKLGATSREKKVKGLTWEELLALWSDRVSADEKLAIHNTVVNANKPIKVQDRSKEALQYGLDHLLHGSSVVQERKVITEALKHGLGESTLESILNEVNTRKDLIRREDGVRMITTQAMLDQERATWKLVVNGRGKFKPVTTKPTLNPDLSDEQRAAISGLLKSFDQVNMVDAGQGTGKTTMLEEYGKELAKAKVPAIWLGTTNTAVDELKKKGLPAMTVASFLKLDEKPQGRIIVDEASMLGHTDAFNLFTHAKQTNSRIDLVGDSKQHKTPIAGDVMLLLKKYAGIEPISMKKTMRQAGRLKVAMDTIRDGNVLKGHDILTELKMVHHLPASQLTDKAAELYVEWSKGEYVPLVSPTHAQAEEIAAKIREKKRARGEITGPDRIVRKLVNLNWTPAQMKEARKNKPEETLLRYGAFREETLPLAVGDEVRTTMSGKSKDGHRFNGGQRYTIKGFTKDDDPILNNGWVIDKNWGGLTQGYVTTSQGTQGKTSRRGIVVYGSPSLVATKQEGFYVPVSRARQEVAVLTDNIEALRDAIQKQEVKVLASDLVRKPKHHLRKRAKKYLAFVRNVSVSLGSLLKNRDREFSYER